MPRTCRFCLHPLSECICDEETEVPSDLTFGGALAALKDGGRVSRAAWPNGVFLYLVPGSTFQVNRPPLLGIYDEGTVINYRPHIDIRMADGTCAPWQPGQDSLVAEDWYEV